MPELLYDGSRSKTSPPQGMMRSDRQSSRTSPISRDEKELSMYRKPYSFAKMPTSLSDIGSSKRVAAMISQPEKSLDAQQSSCMMHILLNNDLFNMQRYTVEISRDILHCRCY
jgi:hypothetical protein